MVTHLEFGRFAKNVGSGWIGLLVNVITGLVLSPYILHRLGDDGFGLWMLVFAITSYFGIMNFGVRTAVVRYVASFSATGDNQQLNAVVNTSLAIYGLVSMIAFLATIVISMFLDSFVHARGSYAHSANVLFLIIGSSVALGLPLGVFTAVLEGIQRFSVINAANIISTLTRTVLIVAALHWGYGLITIGLISAVVALLNQLVNMANAFRFAPIRVAPLAFVNKTILKKLMNYGSASLVINIAGNLRFRADELVIGSVLSAAAITPFAIGARILDYATAFVDSVSQVFTPMSSHFDAKGETANLRSILIAGNRACALLVLPICASLPIFGKPLIEVWMGARYVTQSYPVLIVLLVGYAIRMSQASSTRILSGMAKHKVFALVALVEGIVNVILSIVLTLRYGIVGCALGTSIPMLLTCVLFLPHHICRVLKVPLHTYLFEAYAIPLVACAPIVVAGSLLKRIIAPHTFIQLGVSFLVLAALHSFFVYYFYFKRDPALVPYSKARLLSTDPEL